jgi:hypothetical protein
MDISSNRVIPATKVRFELTKILPQIQDSRYFVLTYKGYPKAALVDIKYLEKLERRRIFDALLKETSGMFSDYLKTIGKDINTISEKEANEIIWRLAGIT